MHSTGTGQPVETQDVFFWRLAGRSAPTGLAIVHWIGCINAIKVVVSVVSSSEEAVRVPWSRDPPDPKTMASLATLGPLQSSCMDMLLYFELLVAGWLLDRRHSHLGLPNRYSMHHKDT